MLNTCFGHAPNDRKTNANATKVLKPNHGKSFESRAFDALYLNRHKYGISELYRCHAARMDGYLVTTDGETILLEMEGVPRVASPSGGQLSIPDGKSAVEAECQTGDYRVRAHLRRVVAYQAAWRLGAARPSCHRAFTPYRNRGTADLRRSTRGVTRDC